MLKLMDDNSNPEAQNQNKTEATAPQNQSSKNTNKPGKKKLLLIIGGSLLALLLIVGAVKALTGNKGDKFQQRDMGRQERDNGKQNGRDGGGSFISQYGQNCENKTDVKFTHFPVPVAQLGQIEPMGKVEDGHVTPTDHLYLAPLNRQAADNTTDVVMPADGRVVMVAAMPAQYIGDRKQQTAPEDHRLIVSYGCQYFSIFIHVHKLSEALQKEVGNMEPNTQKNVSISLKAGEKLGKIGGNPVDFTMLDTTKKLTGFINPDQYASEAWKIHTIDPFPLYSGDLKAQITAKSLRSAEPLGGKIDYDQPGKLVGTWFKEGTNGYAGKSMNRYWDGHLSIAPDYIDPSVTIVSIGNWQGKAAQFAVHQPSAKPETVSAANGPVKYHLVNRQYMAGSRPWVGSTFAKGITLDVNNAPEAGVILLQVLDGSKLKVEKFPGQSLAQVKGFTKNAAIYTR
jgi:hypothetical protein